MKAGKSVKELALEVIRQAKLKKDYIADTRAVSMQSELIEAGREVCGKLLPPKYEPRLVLANGERIFNMPANDLAHDQIAARLDIPRAYYKRMAIEQPQLLATNVNTWLAKNPEKRMIRTLDNRVRAFLSDKFRPLENLDLAEAIMPVLGKLDVEIMSSEITERRLYIKAIDRSVTRDIPTGKKLGDASHTFFDTMSPAIVISNSEVGAGALSVQTGVYTKVCTNLAIMGERSMRKYHVGARADLGEEVYALLSDQTRRVTDAALWLQVRDIVKGAFDRARFDASVDQIAGLVEQKIDGDPVKVVEVAAKQFQLSDGERGSVLKHLIEGGELTRYGLFNAITRTAEDLGDYDRATEFEQLGGRVIELPKSDWKRIAEAGKIAEAA